MDFSDLGIGVPQGLTPLDSLLADYVVEVGNNIVAGDLVKFINGKVSKISNVYNSLASESTTTTATATYSVATDMTADRLTETSILVTYKSGDTYGYALILTINSDNSISRSVPYCFNAGYSDNNYVSVLSSTKAVVCFYQSATTYGYACVLNINGTTITQGVTKVFSANSRSNEINAVMLTPTTVLVVDYGTTTSRAYVLTVNVNDTISVTTPIVITTKGAGQGICLSRISSTKVVVSCYQTTTIPYSVDLIILNISGTAISIVGAKEIYTGEQSTDTKIVKITDTKIVLMYQTIVTIPRKVYVIACDITNNTITKGVPVELYSGKTASETFFYRVADNFLIDIHKNDLKACINCYSINGLSITITAFDVAIKSSGATNKYSLIGIKDSAILVIDSNYIGAYILKKVLPDGIAKTKGSVNETIKCYKFNN